MGLSRISINTLCLRKRESITDLQGRLFLFCEADALQFTVLYSNGSASVLCMCDLFLNHILAISHIHMMHQISVPYHGRISNEFDSNSGEITIFGNDNSSCRTVQSLQNASSAYLCLRASYWRHKHESWWVPTS